jgi:diguanylate cyclase (GGDEF)-like protein
MNLEGWFCYPDGLPGSLPGGTPLPGFDALPGDQDMAADIDHFRHAIELSAQIPWMVHADGTLSELGGRWRQAMAMALALEDALGDGPIPAVHPEDRTCAIEAWRRSFSAGRPLDHECRLRVPDGSYRWFRSRAGPMHDADGMIVRWYGTTEDVQERWDAANEARWQLYHDSLTGIGNRWALEKALEEALQRGDESTRAIAVLLVDVDRFKLVNDRFGHAAGDALLKWCGQRLHDARGAVLAARLGGDEFAILLTAPTRIELVANAEHVSRALHGWMMHGGARIESSVSAGLAIYPDHGRIAEDLIKSADVALYEAKAGGRNCMRVYEAEMRAELQRTSSMLAMAREALNAGRILPYYQPQVRLATGRVVGFEALLRWIHPTRGLQVPGTIAAAFEDRELAGIVSTTMLDQFTADMRTWLDADVPFGGMAINASGADLRDPGYADRFLRRLEVLNLPANLFEIEITENAFLGRGTECSERNVRALSAAGVRIALDDFGTGYASLAHLQRFPVNVIKIDRSFVQPLGDDCKDTPITQAVIGLARSFQMTCVAEGIETLQQAVLLRRSGCGVGQGYLFGKAAPAEMVPQMASHPARHSPRQRDRRASRRLGRLQPGK